MSNIDEIIESLANAEDSARRKMILELIDKIVRGEIRSSEVPLDEIFQMHTSLRDQRLFGGPRREYISPADRSSYDYGYMKIPDMSGAGVLAV